MKLPEKAPTANFRPEIFAYIGNKELQPTISKAQQEYYPWEKVKYIKLPDNIKATDVWSLLQLMRTQTAVHLKFGKYTFTFNLTPTIQKTLHECDMNYGGRMGSSAPLNETDKQQYLISSIMEEAIASSQIEGAVTTRRIAKDMLKQNRAPRNKSERMILNNYETIRHIRGISKEPLSEAGLLEIQRLMTLETLDDPIDAGHFRTDNNIKVIDSTDGTVMHEPPLIDELPELMTDLYSFFNSDREDVFIHPIIKACILHFMVGYIHPFVDGNGRTARALFYWYMLKKGYWLTEYLSISGVILKSRTAYGKAYLHTEIDNLDLTYFINYKMRVIRLAYESLQSYLKRKIAEKNAASSFMRLGGINDRQALILQSVSEEPERVLTVIEIETWFSVANQTARNDLQSLADMHLLRVKQVNKKKQVYIKSEEFDSTIKILKAHNI